MFNRHRLEVQADVSSSETASAVTCVSEKSGNTLNDTASTRALAGSILSYKQVIKENRKFSVPYYFNKFILRSKWIHPI